MKPNRLRNRLSGLPRLLSGFLRRHRAPILILLLSKTLIFSIGFAVTFVNEGPSDPGSIILRQFCRWDGPHYLNIARNWYSNVGESRLLIVFLPLYPALIRLTSPDPQLMGLSALLISNLASAAAAILLFRLVRMDLGEGVAGRAVLYLCLFPTAYFMCAVYTEGLFLGLAVASVYQARRGRWLAAGTLGMLASLTRLTGLVLFPTLLLEYLHQRRWKLRKAGPDILFPGLTLVGFLIYLLINFAVTGGFFTFMEIERTHWHQSIDPISGLKGAWEWQFYATFPDSVTVGSSQIAFATLGLLGVAGSFLRLRPSYGVYSLLVWMLSVSTGWWISVPRYILAMFPLFILLGLLGRRKKFNYALVPVFSVSLIFFTVLFSLGRWAF